MCLRCDLSVSDHSHKYTFAARCELLQSRAVLHQLRLPLARWRRLARRWTNLDRTTQVVFQPWYGDEGALLGLVGRNLLTLWPWPSRRKDAAKKLFLLVQRRSDTSCFLARVPSVRTHTSSHSPRDRGKILELSLESQRGSLEEMPLDYHIVLGMRLWSASDSLWMPASKRIGRRDSQGTRDTFDKPPVRSQNQSRREFCSTTSDWLGFPDLFWR